MKSKIDYHVLTMDEIVFDNRNKAYGAFIVRQHYERNLLKAIFISIGIFGLTMSSPVILRSVGLFSGVQESPFVKEIYVFEDFPGFKGPSIETKTELPPSHPDDKPKEVSPVEKDKLPDNKPETPTTTATTSSNNNNSQTGGNDGGIPTGNGNIINEDDVIKEKKPEFYDIKTVEQMPEFIGGQPAFEEFVQDNIVYPVDEKADGVEGTVRIQFIVTEDGILQNIGIYKSSGNRNLDKEALRLVRSLPKYKPGRQNGAAVKVFCILPIHFLIE